MPQMAGFKLNHKLSEDIGHNFVPVGQEQDLFGVEIELEGKKLICGSLEMMKYWITHSDGSLRIRAPGDEAFEYVFKRPLNMADTRVALKTLFNYLNNNPGTKVYDSYRTSIHVHINFLNDTIRTLVNFITLSIIFDELFVSQNGETRIGNNFCLRARDAEGQIAEMVKSIQKYGTLYNLVSEHRYSSVNVASIMKFGTVEFRSLECTTDYDRVIHWIRTIQALKEAARTYDNPRQIVSKFSNHGPMGFIIKNLGDQYAKYVRVPGYQQMLNNGMRLAQDFAFCSEWQQPDESKAKTTKSSPALKKMIGNEDLYWNNAPPPAIAPVVMPNGGAAGIAGWAQFIAHQNAMENAIHAAAAQPAVEEVVADDDDDDDDMNDFLFGDAPEPDDDL